MSRGINKVILVGNLGKDPEMKNFDGGSRVANFVVATSEEWLDAKSNERVKKTEWHKIVTWGVLGDTVMKYLKKGSKVYLEGKLQTRSYRDSNDVERWTTEINMYELRMLDSHPEDNGQQAPQAPAPPPRS